MTNFSPHVFQLLVLSLSLTAGFSCLFSFSITAPATAIQLGYLKDSNAAAHSVDSDIFYVVIDLSARSKYYISRGV